MIEHIILKQSCFTRSFEGNLNIIDKHIEHIKEFDEGRVKTNKGGFQSNDITFGFKELINSIEKGFEELKFNVRLENFWLNINKGSDSNTTHIHSPYFWSVIYYHKVCCENSPLIFSSLVPVIHQEICTYTPKPQEIIYFPGWYPHSVKGCDQNNHERVSIAFNFFKI
tara:strand:- start:356 stop:859 length:504 start_codon:yes stop_codon:yes gene_type:complete